jgi:hypothetical protein
MDCICKRQTQQCASRLWATISFGSQGRLQQHLTRSKQEERRQLQQ